MKILISIFCFLMLVTHNATAASSVPDHLQYIQNIKSGTLTREEGNNFTLTAKSESAWLSELINSKVVGLANIQEFVRNYKRDHICFGKTPKLFLEILSFENDAQLMRFTYQVNNLEFVNNELVYRITARGVKKSESMPAKLALSNPVIVMHCEK